ncbi:hypothetical protein EK0264_18015 [Epidermidibacterium keratini]|uniref:Asp23/Gls24 family envelope stress response protein n=1 Tax=Epidermidibacterium keratini TaxID=1891644 RepID=A0A7L4YRY9_9ACTN|nr:hypothetical protein [Epidermidibacterium keratini]QHC01985.1 hypothetical protein EK0264_18015 [Epidermidibacterium keratini]
MSTPDAVAIERAVRAVPGVGAMHAGPHGTASSFTADGRIWGVRIAPDAIDIHVTSYPGLDLQALGKAVRAAVLAVAGDYAGKVRVHIEDLVEPDDLASDAGQPSPGRTS